MAQINVQVDCGNSPKKAFLRDFNIAFAEGNADYIINAVTDDIVWTIVGDKRVIGKDDFTKTIHEMEDFFIKELTIHTIITHGREASVNGVMVMPDGKCYSFCDIYHFKNTTSTDIKSMMSYVIEVANE